MSEIYGIAILVVLALVIFRKPHNAEEVHVQDEDAQ